MMKLKIGLSLLLISLTAYIHAGEVEIVHASAAKVGEQRYDFSVTLKHQDTGWDHYADAWEVLDANTREVLGVRTLHHPHVDEQPFTRSLAGVDVASKKVIIRARDSVHGYSSDEFELDL